MRWWQTRPRKDAQDNLLHVIFQQKVTSDCLLCLKKQSDHKCSRAGSCVKHCLDESCVQDKIWSVWGLQLVPRGCPRAWLCTCTKPADISSQGFFFHQSNNQWTGEGFSSVGAEVMIGIQACHRVSETSCMQSLQKLALHYNIQDILRVIKLLDPVMFPSWKVILQVAVAIPFSGCERSLSALQRLHTWLRPTVGQERLKDLAGLSTEGESLLEALMMTNGMKRFFPRKKII